MASLRKTMGIPFGISHPEWLLNIGAQIIRTETELILKSRNVVPNRLLDNNFSFKHKNIQNALSDLLNN